MVISLDYKYLNVEQMFYKLYGIILEDRLRHAKIEIINLKIL